MRGWVGMDIIFLEPHIEKDYALDDVTIHILLH